VGSIADPVLERARKLIAVRDLRSATNLLASEIDLRPADSNLLSELGIIYTLQGREDQAFELLPLAAHGESGPLLLRSLANHYKCRLLLDPKDFDAAKRLDLLSSLNGSPDPSIGVSISACLIVKNEEGCLERCLASLNALVSEIVVVDTGSTDRTVQIAQDFGAVLGHFAWNDDFSAARNAALDLATGDWILWIDADEEIEQHSIDAFKRAVVRPHFGGFDIEIINYTEDRVGGNEFQHCPTRLFRRLPEIRFSGRIHEQVTPSLIKLSMPWARLVGAKIFHYGYLPGELKRKNKIERTIGLLEKEIRENPSDPFQWFNLANAHVVAGNLCG
jgi:tetratricopeptide (TPR) repeat protein